MHPDAFARNIWPRCKILHLSSFNFKKHLLSHFSSQLRSSQMCARPPAGLSQLWVLELHTHWFLRQKGTAFATTPSCMFYPTIYHHSLPVHLGQFSPSLYLSVTQSKALLRWPANLLAKAFMPHFDRWILCLLNIDAQSPAIIKA